ncbi:hypothetical protein H6F88_01060 [Oculatella sp. FACHB-28]|uniref:hypothetical protein n=1 Tax=Oculatella sp. FACHB-28 TaxID=2692845 RepID=UPI00168686F8|nr:hypothetical protein [Oculatella sp. FACHB-28]MBD2054630.1 hypothetical protein [Oculatella sp. FACHB-28]
MGFDPRTIGKPVYEALSGLRSLPNQDDARLKEQKNQAVELYTYLSTWGMLRLKAEEEAISKDKPGKRQVVEKFFLCLEEIAATTEYQGLSSENGLKVLLKLDTDEYLGLMGLGLAIAQEFSFWATAVYHDIKGEA